MEIWKNIKGYEGLYQVSNKGNVKSLNRFRSNGGVLKERVLKQSNDGHGYLKVGLCKNSKINSIKVHKLVAISFLDHIPKGYEIVVDHINNIKTDNKIENLELITNRENCSKDRKGSSKYTGVSWHKKSGKWLSSIYKNGKNNHLGLFISEIEASNTYQKSLEK